MRRLSTSQKRKLLKDGFVVLPGLVAPDRIRAALRQINNRISQGPPAQESGQPQSRTYWTENTGHPAILDLLRGGPAWEIAESLIGRGAITPVTFAQLVLRFPNLDDALPPPGFHIDGFYPGGREIEHTFTMLVHVFLNDIPGPFSGNLAVCPGSHRVVEDLVRRHGVGRLRRALERTPWPKTVPVTGKTGDVAICHYQLVHYAQENQSPHIRYAAYFRLLEKNHHRRREKALADAWLEWPGLRSP